jgi:hypothetical protein
VRGDSPSGLAAPTVAPAGSGALGDLSDSGSHGAQSGSVAPGSPAPDSVPGATPERTERLVRALASMCQRGGFKGAALVDALGRPLAEHQPSLSTEQVCSVATALSATVERAGKLLQQPQVNRLSLDFDRADKAVLRRFEVEAGAFSLLVICLRAVDERYEVGLSVEILRKILSPD